MPSPHKRAAACVFMLSLAFPTALVHACSCAPPSPGPWFIGPPSGDLPANAAGVAFWYYSRSEEQAGSNKLAADFVVEKFDQGEFHELSAKVSAVESFPGIYVVAPQNGLAPGATYRFTTEAQVREGGYEIMPQRVHVIVDEKSLLAGEKIGMDVSEVFIDDIDVAASGHCADRLRAANVRLAAGPPYGWREQLLYRTLVDGKIWRALEHMCQSNPPGRSWQEEVGSDLVYAACDWEQDSWIQQGVKPGRHTVKMQAFLPGTDVVLESDEFTVNLRCK